MTPFRGVFFTICQDRCQAFRLGSRPEFLPGGKMPAKEDLRAFKVFEKRQEHSPIAKARECQRRMHECAVTSAREFARETGEDWSVIARHLRLLQLPEQIIVFLEQNQTPEVLRHFTLKRLDNLTRLPATQALDAFQNQVNSLNLATEWSNG